MIILFTLINILPKNFVGLKIMFNFAAQKHLDIQLNVLTKASRRLQLYKV